MPAREYETEDSPGKKRRRWLKILLICLVVLSALIALAPTIASTSPVRRLALGRINRQINGQLSIESWSLGWFSGVSLQGISLLDEQSQRVAEVQSVILDPFYSSLLGRNPQLGHIRVQGLRLEVRIDRQGQTNLEKIVPARPKPPEPQARQVSFDLQMDQATVLIHIPDAGPLSVHNLNATVQMATGPQPLNFSFNCDLADAQATGHIQAQGLIPTDSTGRLLKKQLQLKADLAVQRFDLTLLAPLLQRTGLDLAVSGLLDAQARTEINGRQNIQLDCQATCPDIRLTGNMLKTDQLLFRNLSFQIQASRLKDQITLQSLSLDSDLIELHSKGEVYLSPAGQLSESTPTTLTGGLTVDLPAILNQLPGTLSLKPGLKVTQGQLGVAYSVANTSEGPVELSGSASLKKLLGTINNKTVRLDQPIEFVFELFHRKDAGFYVRHLDVNSGFADISGSGTFEAFTFQSQFELAKLNTQLAQFVDLGPKSFAGQIRCYGNVTRKDHRFDIQTHLSGTDLLLKGLGRRDLREPTVKLDVKGSFTPGRQESPAVVNLQGVRLSTQLSQLEFTGRIDLKPLACTGKLTFNSDLARLGSYLAQFTDLGDLALAGKINCDTDINGKNLRWDFHTDIRARDFVVSGLDSGDIRQPQLQANIKGSVAQAPDNKQVISVIIDQAELDGQPGRLGFSGQANLQPLVISGQATIDADLARLWNLAAPLAKLPPGIRPKGKLHSDLSVKTTESQVIASSGSSSITDLQLSHGDGRTVNQPKLTVQHQLSYDPQAKTLACELLIVKQPGLTVRLEKLHLRQRPENQLDMDLQTDYQANLARLTPWLVFFDKLDPQAKLGGKLTGQASYFRQGQKEDFTIDSQVLDLQVHLPNQPVFAEPKITLQVTGATDRTSKTIELSQFKIASSFLQADALVSSGLDRQSSAQVNLQGQCQLARLSQLLKPWLSDWPELKGSARLQMALTGTGPQADRSAWLASLGGTGKIEFDQQLLGGLSLGPANIDLQVEKGLLTIAPTAIPANQGKMNIALGLALSGKRPFLFIPQPIKLLEDVQINPQMSEALLKFINPIFANSHEVSGTVNFTCNRLVVDDPKTWKKTAKMTGLFSGKDLLIKSRQGVMHDLGSVLEHDLSAKLGELRPVGIELADGAVTYKDMHIVFGPVVDLSFSGQVGLDESLDMQIGIPILPAMLGNRPELIKILGDQRIYLPITGTVSNPRLDMAALPELLAKTITEALLKNATNFGKVLDDLLKPQLTPLVPAPTPTPSK